MRKLLFSLIIVLLAVGTYFFLSDGITIGAFDVKGIKSIQDLSTTLDNKVAEATELTTIEFNGANKTLNNAISDLQTKRMEYEDKVAISNEDTVKKASTKEKYEIQYLWTIIGNYATADGVKLTVDFRVSSEGAEGEKDLDFTLEGAYTKIIKFLYDIEDDENLSGFRIEDFRLLPIKPSSADKEAGSAVSNLQAKFSVKGINVDLG